MKNIIIIASFTPRNAAYGTNQGGKKERRKSQ